MTEDEGRWILIGTRPSHRVIPTETARIHQRFAHRNGSCQAVMCILLLHPFAGLRPEARRVPARPSEHDWICSKESHSTSHWPEGAYHGGSSGEAPLQDYES